MTEETLPKLIHVARIQPPKRGIQYLFLRKKDAHHYVWFQENEQGREEESGVQASTIEEAIRLASHHWKHQALRMVNCGFRYTLPERDEHGYNALFHQMALSYSSGNGIYFDEETGNNCFINFASDEAKNLLADLKKNKRL